MGSILDLFLLNLSLNDVYYGNYLLGAIPKELPSAPGVKKYARNQNHKVPI